MASIKVDQVRQELGLKLKAAREKSKLTQAEVAMISGVNVNYYARIERGEENPSYEKLTKIMKALEMKSLDVSSKSS